MNIARYTFAPEARPTFPKTVGGGAPDNQIPHTLLRDAIEIPNTKRLTYIRPGFYGLGITRILQRRPELGHHAHFLFISDTEGYEGDAQYVVCSVQDESMIQPLATAMLMPLEPITIHETRTFFIRHQYNIARAFDIAMPIVDLSDPQQYTVLGALERVSIASLLLDTVSPTSSLSERS